MKTSNADKFVITFSVDGSRVFEKEYKSESAARKCYEKQLVSRGVIASLKPRERGVARLQSVSGISYDSLCTHNWNTTLQTWW